MMQVESQADISVYILQSKQT